MIQKRISKKLLPIRKKPYQIIEKLADVTYKLTDHNQKGIVQYKNNLLSYYPKEYALRELTQLYSFTGLHIFDKITESNDQEKTTDFCYLP